MKIIINWPQAIAEVSLLLLGATIAITADTWLKEQNENVVSEQYLQSLAEDLSQTKQNLQNTIIKNKQYNISTNELLSKINAGNLNVNDDELAKLYMESHSVDIALIIFSTYHDMIYSGNLGLIDDAELRLKLVNYKVMSSEYIMIISERFNQWNYLQVPFMVSNIDISSIFSGRAEELIFPTQNIDIDRKNILSREQANILSIRLLSDIDVLLYEKSMLNETNLILELINQTLVRD